MPKRPYLSCGEQISHPVTRERLRRARALIDACYDRPLDLEQIAQEASFSRYHFIRLFRQAFDTTPHQYLIERRLERAKALLASGELSVTEVCFAVGFQSLGSFSALFHRAVGHPPKRHRASTLARGWSPRVFVPACFLDVDADVFYLFEIYRDREALAANGQASWFFAYLQEVQPLLAGMPEVVTATPLWQKAPGGQYKTAEVSAQFSTGDC